MLLVSWPNAGDATLEENEVFANDGWNPSTAPVSVIADRKVVEVSPVDSARFYRLRIP
jgi:hypothetical protein